MREDAVIRFAEEDDVSALIELCAKHAAFEEASYNASGKAERLRESLFGVTPALYCLVAEVDQQVLGYATYMKQYSTWDASFYLYMDCLYLMGDARGEGIGQLIMDRIKKEGRQLGCDHVQWQTPDFNKRAIKFYHRIGAMSKSKERFFLDID